MTISIMNRIIDPKKIEEKSFEIIEGLLPPLDLSPEEKAVLKRVIHTTTDLEYAKMLLFHPKAVSVGVSAIKSGKNVICDVTMVEAGINKKTLSSFGGKVICLINDVNVIKQAQELKIARAIVAMQEAAKYMDGAIIAIGNAPTALFEICDLIRKNKIKPALIVGIPVGFVGAAESKKELSMLNVPFITNIGTKGGSPVAAAIINALLKLAKERV